MQRKQKDEHFVTRCAFFAELTPVVIQSVAFLFEPVHAGFILSVILFSRMRMETFERTKKKSTFKALYFHSEQI